MQLSRWQRASINSVAANRARMARTGLTAAGQRLWVPYEIRTLHDLHPDFDAVLKVLTHRTLAAVRSKAFREGLTRSRRIWNAGDVAVMRPPYRRGDPVSEIAARVKKTKRQVWDKAAKNNIRRPRRPFKPTGIPLVDAVRDRAFRLHISMCGLGEDTGHPAYFRSPRHMKPKAIQRAVGQLEGRFVLRWIDGTR